MTSPSNLASQDEANTTTRRAPPPIPPRASQSNEMKPPPSYSSVMAMSSHDPRSSSTQSLIPDPSLENTGRRRILLVYIHGFMGNETSFRSFPAHVHNLVSVTLADTHVVHTKIYPRYRARYSLMQARDQFSAWLTPHEDQWTDIILLGHSMGGLLAADIALLFRHRIIGIINFDVPFVGMHPGIIKAGLGSIFKSTPPPKDQILQTSPEGAKPSRMSTIFNPKPSDPNYNPSFSNDVHLPVRKGLDNALHWFNKHSNDIREAGKGLIKSHFEFGSAMADYKELKDRYARVRALEEDDQSKRQQGNPGVRSPPRIRFVNYYTATTGRMKEPKKPKAPKSPSPPRSGSVSLQHRDSDASGVSTSSQQRSGQTNLASGSQPSSSLDVNDHQGKRIVPVPPQQVLSAAGPQKSFSDSDDALDSERPVLPEIPPIPQEPPFVDLMQYTDRAQRRAAAREHEEALEEYQKAVKARNKAIDEREDLEEEWETQRQHRAAAKPKKVELTGEELRLEQEKERMAREQARLEGKEYQPSSSRNVNDSQKTPGLDDGLHTMSLGEQPSRSPYANYDFSRSAILSQPDPDDQASVTDSNYTATTNDTDTSPTDSDKKPQKQKKLGKFCVLPPKDAAGHKDPTWVRVHMDGMDEVAAHTSLFFVNETYERLVGDVGARIEDWVREADSERVVREMSGMA